MAMIVAVMFFTTHAVIIVVMVAMLCCRLVIEIMPFFEFVKFMRARFNAKFLSHITPASLFIGAIDSYDIINSAVGHFSEAENHIRI